MTEKQTVVLIGIIACLAIAGCNIGMQPEGPSLDQVKAKEASLPPDQQIALLKTAPMPSAEKEAKIAEIKAKYGIK